MDRAEDLAELRHLAASLAAGRDGWGMVVEGASGIGKSALLRVFEEQVAGGSCRVVTARCAPGTGPDFRYGPVLDLLVELEASARRRNRARQVLTGVAESVPLALSVLVPGLDKVFAAGQQVVSAAVAAGSMPVDSVLPFAEAAVVRIVHELVRTARKQPMILVVDDLQYCDQSSLHVFDRLLNRLHDAPVGLLLSHSTEGAYIGGPGEQVATLLDRWEHDRLVRRRILTGLPEDAVAQLVAHRYPDAPPALSERLSEVTLGHSIFVSLCLAEWRPEQGDRIVLPTSLSRVVEGRLATLSEKDRELLVIGATQGETFLSSTVAVAADMSHDEVIERLHRISGHGSLIAEAPRPDWARWDGTDCYRFEHRALRQVIYRQQSAQQRRSRHAAIAAALRSVDGPVPLERRLEIARHLRDAAPLCLAESSDVHYALARDAAVDGLSFSEAERHCHQAIRDARGLPATAPDRDRLLVQAIELLLSLTEVRWRGGHQGTGPDIDVLAAEAEEAAARCQLPAVQIRAMLLRGKTLMATRGQTAALAKLREAVSMAERHGDPIALYVTRVEYGRQVSKESLDEALRQLHEAERLYASEPRLGGRHDPVLQHTRNLAEMQLGITLYDGGQLGAALSRLRRCVDRLNGEALHVELPIAGNYLGQVYAALGEYERAAAVLSQARSDEDERGVDSGWHAYNTALLAYVRSTSPGRRDEVLALMAEAWAETERTWLANLVPIVRNLYAEIVLDYAADDDDLAQALRLATETCRETAESGMRRSEIAAHSLRGRILQQRGDGAAAEDATRAALQILDEVGHMPALRTEEVLYHAAVVLHARGAGGEAAELLARARAEVARKAGLIGDVALRKRFLAQVPLNRAIRRGDGVRDAPGDM